jgi:hypothetical protein
VITEAINRILDLAAPVYAEQCGLTYASKAPVLIMPPVDAEIQVGTLTGFADAISALGLNDPVVLLRVASPTFVECATVQADNWGRRQVHVTVKHEHTPFRFGTFMSPEEMVIGLQSKFVAGQQDDLAYVCQMVGNISNEIAAKTEDDGVSQSVAVRRGISLKGVEKLRPIVNLTAWRTFTEVPQPLSPFLFRARSVGTETQLALIEADGGEWKVQAAEAIATWLKNNESTKDIVTVR